MTRKVAKAQKSQIVAFKVEEDLADFLDKLPNKSEFIRKAILAQFGMTCPLCAGTGVVDEGFTITTSRSSPSTTTRPCEKCKTVSFPLSVESGRLRDRRPYQPVPPRRPALLREVLPGCPPCDDCGWHVMMEKVAEHFKKVHIH